MVAGKNDDLIADIPADAREGRLRHLGGSASDLLNSTLLEQAAGSLSIQHSDQAALDRQVGATIAGLGGIAPRDELEGMMAAQLIAAHNAAMECHRRAADGGQNPTIRQANLNQANKLSRTWVALLEALNKHRGKGQQRVTVEHVHVYPGAQSMVRTVGPERGGGKILEDQPHAKQIADAHEPALQGADPSGHAMQVARDAERPMPNARGTGNGRP